MGHSEGERWRKHEFGCARLPYSQNLDGETAVSACEETSPTSGRASEVTVVPLSGSLLTEI
jgi:hypothetical protein